MSLENIQAYIGLGANLGDPKSNLIEALRRISLLKGVCLRKVSGFYRSSPVDASGPDYVNAVASIHTRLAADDLLCELFAIEKALGRVRPAGVARAPRTIDLDLLLYADFVSNSEFLTLPHPRMHERAFVLVPLLEIAPNLIIPGRGLAKDYLPSVGNQTVVKMDNVSNGDLASGMEGLNLVSAN